MNNQLLRIELFQKRLGEPVEIGDDLRQLLLDPLGRALAASLGSM